MTSKFLVCVLAFALFGLQVHAQGQWDNYQPRTLSQIIKQHLGELTDNGAEVYFLLTADHFPSRVKVIYTGKSRKMPPKRREIISEWANSERVDKEIVNLFEEELLFIEDSVEYWMPVQKQLPPFFGRELKKGEEVELLLIWIGARKEAGKVEWVFLVNEFVTTESSRSLRRHQIHAPINFLFLSTLTRKLPTDQMRVASLRLTSPARLVQQFGS